ncbi:LysE family translocator [Thiomicrospira cyclica]|uniref:Lysine exporter protein (LYSE/YGGA) n=1 Tax=Thiomicrospira cyclica (strain DSM 14477 / JCM 11371 / ALM1) TaxID=717773 RepID=F6DD40_THICA|nr:LysE family translocator [Thiomicrospira cyclica]AEG31776.1 Lysine exporter protein (LYSE/YGGA) [Thiomicrospira cyclica ALM1]
MTFNLLLSLSIALTLVAAAPGPGVIMTVTRTLQFGLTAGLLVVAGIVAMDLVVLMATLAGLNLLTLANQPGLLTLLMVIASLVLIVLGIQSWRRPIILRLDEGHASVSHFMAGIAVSLTNPVLFYLAFLPVFIDLDALTLHDQIVLLALISGVLTLVLGAYALLAAKLKTWLFEQHPERQLWLNRISATVLFILAITLIHSTIS